MKKEIETNKKMKKDKNVLFATERSIENGMPKIICPYCGYITSGWLATKIKSVTKCLKCQNIYRTKK